MISYFLCHTPWTIRTLNVSPWKEKTKRLFKSITLFTQTFCKCVIQHRLLFVIVLLVTCSIYMLWYFSIIDDENGIIYYSAADYVFSVQRYPVKLCYAVGFMWTGLNRFEVTALSCGSGRGRPIPTLGGGSVSSQMFLIYAKTSSYKNRYSSPRTEMFSHLTWNCETKQNSSVLRRKADSMFDGLNIY